MDLRLGPKTLIPAQNGWVLSHVQNDTPPIDNTMWSCFRVSIMAILTQLKWIVQRLQGLYAGQLLKV